MPNNLLPASTVLLAGLDPQLSAELSGFLIKEGQVVQSIASASDFPGAPGLEAVDLVFCSSDPACFQQLRRALQRYRPSASIVVVSRHPEVSDWLDAIEGGAADYCGAPFETFQIRWILESALRSRKAAAAA